MAESERDKSVFVNCPFDAAFKSIFDAIVFAVAACGFRVRSALELADSGELRLQKIMRLLAACRYSIHDISRVELDLGTGLPRFNMPIELGAALGMKHLGRAALRDHRLLVLDSERYRYQTFASDLAGVDISAHRASADEAISSVRDFVATHLDEALPSPSMIREWYRLFEATLADLASSANQKVEELTFRDRYRHIRLFVDRTS